MISKYSRLRMRRKFRARKKVIAQTAETANKELERHVFRRAHNWQTAKRFFITWLVLVSLIAGGLLLQIRGLNAEYTVVTPAPGGVYNEGVVGNIKNINPIFATSTGDLSVATLLFSPLLTYDVNNQLVGDLAKKWESDPASKVFTITLRDDVYWHDGEKLSADDVVFTYQTIQNPDTKSPYYAAWRGIKVEKVDDFRVRFILPNAYSPFFHLLTVGIIPEHKLSEIEKEQLRGNMFNTREAVGTGPFTLSTVSVKNVSDAQSSEEIQLIKYPKYHRGEVKLDGFTIKTYPDDTSLQDAIVNKEVIGGLVEPTDDNDSNTLIRFNQTSEVMLFMNTARLPFSDSKMRRAIISATNPANVSEKLGYPTKEVRSPILKGQLGYDASLVQLPPSPETASTLLNELGWMWNEGDQYRKKDGKELTIQFVSENTTEYVRMAEELQQQWGQYGIKTNALLVDSDEISNLSATADKDYDVLLYAINIGPDPDVYVYWHSSQAKPDAKPGYNFSLYSSAQADQSLEDGRSRADEALRAVKYKPFLEAWRNDIPAIGLHQPRVAYTTNIPVYNLEEMTINTAADRYRNVHNWEINTIKAAPN